MRQALKFYEGRDGRPIARTSRGKIVLPRRGFNPQPGEIWICRVEERERYCIASPILRITPEVLAKRPELLDEYFGWRWAGEDKSQPMLKITLSGVEVMQFPAEVRWRLSGGSLERKLIALGKEKVEYFMPDKAESLGCPPELVKEAWEYHQKQLRKWEELQKEMERKVEEIFRSLGGEEVAWEEVRMEASYCRFRIIWDEEEAFPDYKLEFGVEGELSYSQAFRPVADEIAQKYGFAGWLHLEEAAEDGDLRARAVLKLAEMETRKRYRKVEVYVTDEQYEKALGEISDHARLHYGEVPKYLLERKERRKTVYLPK